METVPKDLYNKIVEELEATKLALSEEMVRAEKAEGRVNELEPLEGKLREATVGRHFDKAAAALKLRPEAAPDVMKLLGDQIGPDADEKAVHDALAKHLESRAYLRGDAAPARPSKLPRDPYAGKGGLGPADGDGGKVPVTRAELKDGDFMERNAALLSSGNFEVVD